MRILDTLGLGALCAMIGFLLFGLPVVIIFEMKNEVMQIILGAAYAYGMGCLAVHCIKDEYGEE